MRQYKPERFWSRVTPEPNTGCWLWDGPADRDGYGRVSISRKRPAQLAHRISWELTHGDPGPSCVLHRCDNRGCVNPAHLFVGDRIANVEDMVAKRRQAMGERTAYGRHPHIIRRGERHESAKLRETDVREIRRRCAAGESQRAVAESYGVHQVTVSLICRKARWAHVS